MPTVLASLKHSRLVRDDAPYPSMLDRVPAGILVGFALVSLSVAAAVCSLAAL